MACAAYMVRSGSGIDPNFLKCSMVVIDYGLKSIIVWDPLKKFKTSILKVKTINVFISDGVLPYSKNRIDSLEPIFCRLSTFTVLATVVD